MKVSILRKHMLSAYQLLVYCNLHERFWYLKSAKKYSHFTYHFVQTVNWNEKKWETICNRRNNNKL